MGIKMTNPILYPIRSDLAIKPRFTMAIWMKTTNYLRKDEVEFLNTIKEKNVLDLTVEELEKYSKIKKQMEVSKLLSKYEDHNCTEEEHDLVCDFMDENSIESFMRSRLTEEEAINSFSFVASLKDKNELEEFVHNEEENFDNLTVQELFTLYQACSRLKNINDRELNDRIRDEQIRRDQALIRSLNRDYGPRFY